MRRLDAENMKTSTRELVYLFLDDEAPKSHLYDEVQKNPLNNEAPNFHEDYHETFPLSTPGESLRIIILYCCKNYSIYNLSFTVNHLAPDTHSEIYAYGLLMNHAQKSCHLTINFQNGAKGATGTEREEVFLLTEAVKNLSSPVLNCAEKDVKGSHSVAIGHFDPAKITYLISRGLPPEQAKSLLARFVLEKSLAHISDLSLKNSVKNALNRVKYNI